MKYCYKCGKQLSDLAKYCDGCGTKQLIESTISQEKVKDSIPNDSSISHPINNKKEKNDDHNVEILGIISLLFAFLNPFVGFILGIIGTKKIKDHSSKYYHMAFASIFVAIVVVLLAILMYILFYFGIAFFSALSWARGIGGKHEILSTMWETIR